MYGKQGPVERMDRCVDTICKLMNGCDHSGYAVAGVVQIIGMVCSAVWLEFLMNYSHNM